MTTAQRKAIADLVYTALAASESTSKELMSKQLKSDAFSLMSHFAMSFEEYKQLSAERFK